MTRARPYSEQEDRFIVESRDANKSNAWIGEHTGRTANAIASRLRDLGVTAKTHNVKREHIAAHLGEIYEPPHHIECDNDKWRDAWAVAHGSRMYCDVRLKREPSPKEIPVSHIGEMTLGGVSAGML